MRLFLKWSNANINIKNSWYTLYQKVSHDLKNFFILNIFSWKQKLKNIGLNCNKWATKFSRFSNSNSPNILQYHFFYSINTLTGLMPIMCGIFPSQMEMLVIQVVFGNAEIIIWTPYLPWQGFLAIFKHVVVVIQKHLIWIQWFYRNFVNFLKKLGKLQIITMLIVSQICWMATTIW